MPLQASTLIASRKAVVDKVYFTESEDHVTFVYCTYEDSPKIPLWIIKDGGFKKWQSIIVDLPEGLSPSFNACALSRNTRHLCVTVSNRIYVYLLSKTAAINSFKLVGHTHETVSVAISRDSKYCASSEKGSLVRVHDLRMGIPLASLTLREPTFVSYLTFCHVADMLLGAGSDAKIHIWDIVSAKELLHLSCSHSTITHLAVSSKKAYILACEDQRYLSLWSLKERSQLFLIKAHGENITSIGINDEEEFVFSTGLDGYLRIWDIGSGRYLAHVLFSSPVKSATIFLQNHFLYCGGRGVVFRYYPLYRLKSGKLIIKDLAEKILPIEYEAQPSAQSEELRETLHNLIKAAAKDVLTFQQKGLTSTSSIDSVKELLKYEEYPSMSMIGVVSAWNELLAAYFPADLVILSSELLYTYPSNLDDGLCITSVALSKYRDKLAYGTSSGLICVLDTVTSKDELLRFSEADYKSDEIASVCFVHNDKLAACTTRHVIFLLEINTAKFLAIKNV